MLHEEKKNGACGFFIKWESISKKLVLWTSNDPPRMPQGHTPLDVIHFWCLLLNDLFSTCRERKMLHVAC